MKSNKAGKRPTAKAAASQAAGAVAPAAAVATRPATRRTAGAIPARWEESAGRTVIWFVLALFVIGMTQHGFFFVDTQKPGLFLAVSFVAIVFVQVKPAIRWRDPVFWGMGALLLGYLLSLADAARFSLAVHGVIVVMVCISMFLVGRIARRGRDAANLVAAGITGLTALLVLHGVLNLAGVMESRDAILSARLGSALQYPNTLGLFCALGVLAAASLTLARDRQWALWHLGTTIGLTGLLLSQSRAMFLMLPVLLVAWGILVGRRTLSELPFFVFDGAVALVAMAALMVPMSRPTARGIWVLGAVVLLGIAAYFGVTLLLKAMTRFRAASRLTVATGSTVLVLILIGLVVRFARAIVTRLSTLHLSDPALVGRVYTWIDGLRIIRAHPLGLGVDGWRAAYFGFASYFYIMNAAHSYLIEVGVSGGILALIGTLFVLAVVAIRVWRNVRNEETHNSRDHAVNAALAIGVLAIVVHAAVDWDLAFMSLHFFFWFLLGYLDALGSAQPLERPATSVRWGSAVAGVLVLAVVGMQWAADSTLTSALAYMQQKQYAASISGIKRAMALDPLNGFFHQDLALAYAGSAPSGNPEAMRQASSEFTLAERYDRFNYAVYLKHGLVLLNGHEYDKAVQETETALKLGPWRQDAWSNYISVFARAADDAAARGDKDAQKRWVQAGRRAMQRLEQQVASQPAFTKLDASYRFPIDDPDLQKSIAHFKEAESKVPSG